MERLYLVIPGFIPCYTRIVKRLYFVYLNCHEEMCISIGFVWCVPISTCYALKSIELEGFDWCGGYKCRGSIIIKEAKLTETIQIHQFWCLMCTHEHTIKKTDKYYNLKIYIHININLNPNFCYSTLTTVIFVQII